MAIAKTTAAFLLLFTMSLASSDRISLYVGQQKTISVKGAEKISIAGRGKVASGTLLDRGRQIILTGKSQGTVSMTISYPGGRKEQKTITVLSLGRQQIMTEFQKISPLFNDIQIISLGNNVGLFGKIYSIKENDYLNAFLGRYPEIINLMEDCRGDVLLQMDVQIIEVNLTDAANLGVDWFTSSTNKVAFSDGLDYGEVKTASGSVTLGEEYVPRRVIPNPQFAVGPIARLSPFTFKLNFLVSKGCAKVLARPKLVCKSGEKAEFHVGGEFPIRTATREKVQIDWKKYGISLVIEPVMVKMGSNEVDARIKVGISDVDWTNAVEGFPGLTQRMVETKVKLAENSAVAIAGLLSTKSSRTQSRIPFLGAIPFLGRLFSSTQDLKSESETVIIIQPRILSIKNEAPNIEIKSDELKNIMKPETR